MAKQTQSARKTKSKAPSRKTRKRAVRRSPQSTLSEAHAGMARMLGLGGDLEATDAEWSRLCLAG